MVEWVERKAGSHELPGISGDFSSPSAQTTPEDTIVPTHALGKDGNIVEHLSHDPKGMGRACLSKHFGGKKVNLIATNPCIYHVYILF